MNHLVRRATNYLTIHSHKQSVASLGTERNSPTKRRSSNLLGCAVLCSACLQCGLYSLSIHIGVFASVQSYFIPSQNSLSSLFISFSFFLFSSLPPSKPFVTYRMFIKRYERSSHALKCDFSYLFGYKPAHMRIRNIYLRLYCYLHVYILAYILTHIDSFLYTHVYLVCRVISCLVKNYLLVAS